MVEIALNVALVALHVGFFVVVAFGECVVAVAHSVRLEVGLGNHINAVAVTQVVPIIIVGVVTGAHGVKVELFHYLYVLQHALARHHIAAVGVKLVTVGAFYQYGLSVYQQLAVLYLHLAETNLYGDKFVATLEACHKGVQVGGLGCPFVGRCHLYFYGFLAVAYSLGYYLAIGVGELKIGFTVAF